MSYLEKFRELDSKLLKEKGSHKDGVKEIEKLFSEADNELDANNSASTMEYDEEMEDAKLDEREDYMMVILLIGIITFIIMVFK